MAEPENAAPEQAPPRKNKKKVILIAVVVLVLGGAAALAMKFRTAPTAKAESENPKGSIPTVKSMMNLEPFLVNLADVDANRFLKVTFRLGLDEEGLGEKYEKDPIMLASTRDKILSLLSTKTADDILTPAGKDGLRKEIKEKVDVLLPKGKVAEVFILDFVVQL